MEEDKIISLLKSVIKTRRNEVIKALQDSTVVLPYNPTNEDLLAISIKELRNDNGYLLYHLGNVIDNFFDENVEKKSNWVAAAIGIGSSLLGKFMGGGDDGKAMAQAQQQAAQAEAARQAAIQKQMLIAASEAEAERLRSETMIKKRKAATQRTILTISLIGGTLLIGGTIAYFALRTKNKQ